MAVWQVSQHRAGFDMVIDQGRNEVRYIADAGCGAEVCRLLAGIDREAQKRRHTNQARLWRQLESVPGFRHAEVDSFECFFAPQNYPHNHQRGECPQALALLDIVTESENESGQWDVVGRLAAADLLEESGMMNESQAIRQTAERIAECA
jgi:hypothetical protein